MRVSNQRHFDEQGTPSRFLFIDKEHSRTLGWLARLLCVLCLAYVIAPTAVAQDDDDKDDEDLAATPGLVTTFESNGKRVLRIDPDVAAAWVGSPDQRLANGGFAATWTANLLTQQAGEYRFHASVERRTPTAGPVPWGWGSAEGREGIGRTNRTRQTSGQEIALRQLP